jgi:hypothetical protein
MSLVEQIKEELASSHLREQAARLARITAVSFAAQVVALGQDHLGRDALVGAAIGAVEAGYRQWSPVVPWGQLASLLHLKEAQAGAAAVAPPHPAPAPVPVAPAVPPAAHAAGE